MNDNNMNMLESARTNLNRLEDIKMQVLCEHEKAEEQVILCFIHAQVNMHATVDKEVTERIVVDLYPDYFFSNYENEYDPYVGVTTTYSYGDLVKDLVNDELCVVVKETECFLHLWCFKYPFNNEKIRRRRKHEDEFTIITKFSFF